jgi:hypothetical protein
MLDRIAGALERYLDLLSVRQKLVASNIANADTPGYRAKDLDFATEFRSLIRGVPPRVIEAPAGGKRPALPGGFHPAAAPDPRGAGGDSRGPRQLRREVDEDELVHGLVGERLGTGGAAHAGGAAG